MGLGAIGLIGSVASTGLSIYSGIQQAKAQEQAAEYNAELARREAANQEAQSAEAIKRRRIENNAALASLRATFAKTGLRTDTGLPLTVIGEAAGRMQVEISDAARATAMQAESLRAKGRMGLWEAEQFSAASSLAALGSGIKGAVSAFDMFQQGRDVGINYRIGK